MENDKKIIAAIQKSLPRVKAIYRFGSAGTARERPESDVDLAVLTDKKLDSSARWHLADVIARMLHKDAVDLVDLLQAPTVLCFQVINEGKRIFCANKTECDLFETITLSDYVRLNEERSGILEEVRKRGRIL
jgi:predicted nucleotidyltransferase